MMLDSLHCPVCGSDSIEYLSGVNTDNVEGMILKMPVSCLDCESEWSEVYKLSDIEVTNRGYVKSKILPLREMFNRHISRASYIWPKGVSHLENETTLVADWIELGSLSTNKNLGCALVFYQDGKLVATFVENPHNLEVEIQFDTPDQSRGSFSLAVTSSVSVTFHFKN